MKSILVFHVYFIFSQTKIYNSDAVCNRHILKNKFQKLSAINKNWIDSNFKGIIIIIQKIKNNSWNMSSIIKGLKNLINDQIRKWYFCNIKENIFSNEHLTMLEYNHIVIMLSKLLLKRLYFNAKTLFIYSLATLFLPFN